MSRARRLGLFWQIALYGVVLLVAAVTISVAVTKALGTPPAVRAQRALLGPVEAARPGDAPLKSDAVKRAVERHPEAPATLYGADGRVLANTAAEPLPLPGRDALAVRPGSAANFDAPFRRVVTLEGGAHLVVGFDVPTSGAFYRVLGILLGSVALVILLLALPMARWIASPLTVLTRTVRALGGGALDARAHLKAPGEIGELASAFDEMADRLQETVRAERALVANVSHELRTPLARMRVALELAEAKGPGRAMQSISEIAVDLADLERMVEDLLSVARLDLAAHAPSGGLPALRRQTVELSALLTACAERFRARHPERLLELSVPGPVTLEGDPALLSRAVDNLLDNARKYSEGVVTLAARANEAVEVSVTDHGEGMSEADLSRAFTPFFRADPSRTRDTGGVGLGLSLTRRIAEAHGGRVTLESVKGQGTTARLLLPR